jgi:hypothetical protein
MQQLLRRPTLALVLLLAPPALAGGARERPEVAADTTAVIAEVQHAVLADADGALHARSRTQGYSASFDERSLSVRADDGAFDFALALTHFGREGALEPVDGAPDTSHAGRRVERRFGPNLTEWYVNRDRGLEHGFTVAERPSGAGDLVVELELTTALAPALSSDLRTLLLADTDGATLARYAGLVAFDADAVDLDARFELDGDVLRIRVDDDSARYPLTIDPIVQTGYIKASNTDADDRFGTSVAVWGDTLVVGAPNEDGASGLNGNQSSNGLSSAGAVYVFVHDGSNWVQEAYIKPSSRGANDRFGTSVDIFENTLVVGATGDDSAATLVGGNSGDNSLSNAGAAWVFERSGSTWSQVAYLKSPSPDSSDSFGISVAIDGEFIVVGANREDSSATGVDGSSANDSASDAGAAYVYRRLVSGWTYDSYLKASNTGVGDQFGLDVGISGDTIVVGAPYENSDANGSGGDQTDESAGDAGALYVFVNGTSGWTQQAYLKATNSDAFDLFGWSVAIDGDRLVVGAPFEDSAATGVNGDQADNTLGGCGAAYVFARSGSNWFAQAYLKPTAGDTNDLFGWSVAISGGLIAVGVREEDGGGQLSLGSPFDDSETDSGAVYLFTPVGFTWEPRTYLKASNTDTSDGFGDALALAGERLVVGAAFEGSSSTGVGGSQFNNSASAAGAVYAFDVGFWELVPGCFANPALILAPARSAYMDETFRFQIQGNSITTGFAASYYGVLGTNVSGCGTLLGLGEELLLLLAPQPTLVSVEPLTGGLADETLAIPNLPSLEGIRVTLQALVVDTSSFATEFSQGLEIEIRP